MIARREQGLCYNYDERFTPGHKCKQRAYLMITEEDELAYLGVEDDNEDVKRSDIPMEETHVSLNAITGNESITIMRLIRSYEGQNLQILIDTRSTLSFIKENTAKRLNLPL